MFSKTVYRCLIIVFIEIISLHYAIAVYGPWNPAKWKGNELLCDHSLCKPNDDICCSCHSKSQWEINNKMEDRSAQNVHIEYIDIRGKGIILTLPNFNDSDFAELVHGNGRLKELPQNICMFPNIIKLDLSNNRLTNINNITCLEKLETLKLENNQLSHLSNKTFQNMTNLRNVSLANNKIKTMDPGAIGGESVNIFSLDLSGNQLKTIDVTNLVMDKLYCDVNYEHNLFQKIGNELGWKVNMSMQYGTGMVRVSQNPPMHFPNYEKLGFAVEQFPKLFKILRNTNFNFGDNIFICDCKLEPLLRYSHIYKPDYSFIFPNFPNFNCSDQGPNTGTNAIIFLKEQERDKLICDLDNDVNCPSLCHCYDQPSKNRIVVNCTNEKLSRPDELKLTPQGIISTRLALYFGNTGLKYLPWHNYFENVSFLDLSYNSFEDLHILFSQNISLFKNLRDLKIHNHSLTSLPKSLMTLDANVLKLGETPIYCDCENIWIGEWRSFYKVNFSFNPLFCKVEGRILPIEEVTNGLLRCNESPFQWTWLLILVCVIMSVTAALTGILVYFRHELHLIFRSLRQKNAPDSPNKLCIDVYISYDVNEFEIRKWVLYDLRQELRQTKLKVYDTVLDTLPGSIRGTVIAIKMAKSKHILIVLSEAYVTGSDPFCIQEFKGAVQQYLKDRSKSLILINFDNIQPSEVSDPYMKAFLRLGRCILFADRHENVSRKINKIIKYNTSTSTL